MTLKCSNCGGGVTQTDDQDLANGRGFITDWKCNDCGNTGERVVDRSGETVDEQLAGLVKE